MDAYVGVGNKSWNKSHSADLGAGEEDIIEVCELPAHLPRDAFEVSSALTAEAAADAQQFNFAHSARASILLNLGFSPASSPSAETLQDILRPYSKASDKACVNAYLSALIGVGTFKLSRAMSKCGWLIGTVSLVGFSLLHVFLCLRLVEVPQLIERNVESTSDLAKALFRKRGAQVFVFFSMLNWFYVCAANLRNLQQNFLTVFILEDTCGVDPLEEKGTMSMLLSIMLLVSLGGFLIHGSLSTGLKATQRKSKLAVTTMFLVAAIETGCAIIHAPYTGFSNYKMVGNFEDVLSGVYDMMFAFAGVSLLPYILADMVNPHNARKVVLEASGKIMLFYLWVALFAYIGWEHEMQTREGSLTPLKMMKCLGGTYGNSAIAMSFLFCVKTVCAFPLYFWPLYREAEQLLMLDESPAVKLQLPWAITHHKRSKIIIKTLLVSACLFPLILDKEHWNLMAPVLVGIPINLTQFIFPSLVSALAFRRHLKLLRERRHEAEDVQKTYIFDSQWIHWFSVHAFALVCVSLGTGCAIRQMYEVKKNF